MKTEIDNKNQLRIIAENTYESLALDAWYNRFFEHYNEQGFISKPLANDSVSMALQIELHGEE